MTDDGSKTASDVDRSDQAPVWRINIQRLVLVFTFSLSFVSFFTPRNSEQTRLKYSESIYKSRRILIMCIGHHALRSSLILCWAQLESPAVASRTSY